MVYIVIINCSSAELPQNENPACTVYFGDTNMPTEFRWTHDNPQVRGYVSLKCNKSTMRQCFVILNISVSGDIEGLGAFVDPTFIDFGGVGYLSQSVEIVIKFKPCENSTIINWTLYGTYSLDGTPTEYDIDEEHGSVTILPCYIGGNSPGEQESENGVANKGDSPMTIIFWFSMFLIGPIILFIPTYYLFFRKKR